MANIPDLRDVDTGFRNEVIDQLLVSVDCGKDFKAYLGQFLANTTAKTNHKHLAYHLFCTVTLYVSKQTTLDEEQMTVLCRIIEQLRREWSGDDVSSEDPNVPPCTRTADNGGVCPKKSLPSTPPRAEPERAGDSIVKNSAGDDIENICEALDRTNIGRSATPDNFVRGAIKHTLTTPNFHEAITPEETSDLKSQYPFGHRLMTKQGWSHQSGLGPDGSGIQRPIDADIMAHIFKENESSAGPASTPKTGSKARADDSSMKKKGKQKENLTGTPPAWNQYAADPDSGDKRVKEGYRYKSNASKTGATRRSYASTNANLKTIAHTQYVINDSWTDALNPKWTHGIQDDVPHEALEETETEPSEKTGAFVPDWRNSDGW